MFASAQSGKRDEWNDAGHASGRRADCDALVSARCAAGKAGHAID